MNGVSGGNSRRTAAFCSSDNALGKATLYETYRSPLCVCSAVESCVGVNRMTPACHMTHGSASLHHELALVPCQVQLVATITATHRVEHGHALALDDHHLARSCHAAGCQCDLVSIQVLDLRVVKAVVGRQLRTHVHDQAPRCKRYNHCRTSMVKPTRASTRVIVTLWCRSDPRRSNLASGAVTMTNCAQACCRWAREHDQSAILRISLPRGKMRSRVMQVKQAGSRDTACCTFRSPGSPSTVGSPCSKNEISCRQTAGAERQLPALTAYKSKADLDMIMPCIYMGSLAR